MGRLSKEKDILCHVVLQKKSPYPREKTNEKGSLWHKEKRIGLIRSDPFTIHYARLLSITCRCQIFHCSLLSVKFTAFLKLAISLFQNAARLNAETQL